VREREEVQVLPREVRRKERLTAKEQRTQRSAEKSFVWHFSEKLLCPFKSASSRSPGSVGI
jgi:hypothetical protein